MSNKSDLVELVSKRLDIPKTKAQDAIDAVLEAISEIAFSSGTAGLTIRGFGRFEAKKRAARVVKTGVTNGTREYQVPERISLVFKASPEQRR